jgi:predicted phosphate transport protein (TIGR00153 family)
MGIFLRMYSGELEVQAKRKALAVLHDEINRILNSARDLSALTASLTRGDEKDIQSCLVRMRNSEEDVENLRRKITREVAEIGSLMAYREDILRTAYIMDDIAGYISGVAFRLASMKISSLKKGKFDDDVKQLIGMVVDAIFKLNEMARALSINPSSTIELAEEVQRLERLVDAKYRSIIIKALNDISVTRDMLLLKDAVEGIEGMADKCQEASDSLTILALSM